MDTTRLLATFRPVVSTSATTTRSPAECSGGLCDGIQAGVFRENCGWLDIVQEGRKLLDGRIRVKWHKYRTKPRAAEEDLENLKTIR